jgi:hypothetical protein
LLHDEYKPNTPSHIKVYDFKTLFKFDVEKADEKIADKIPKLADFAIVLDGEKPNKISNRALWYVDNESFFVSTNDGWVIHYDMKGSIIKKALIH